MGQNVCLIIGVPRVRDHPRRPKTPPPPLHMGPAIPFQPLSPLDAFSCKEDSFPFTLRAGAFNNQKRNRFGGSFFAASVIFLRPSSVVSVVILLSPQKALQSRSAVLYYALFMRKTRPARQSIFIRRRQNP